MCIRDSVKGEPIANAKLWIGNDLFAVTGSGQYASKRFPFLLGQSVDVRYEVEEGAKMQFEIKPSGGAPSLDFETKPAEVPILSEGQKTSVRCPLRTAPGGDNQSFFFVVSDRSGSPWAGGIEVLMSWQGGWRPIGITDPNGRLEYKVNDINAFWASQPKVRLNLNSYDRTLGLSRAIPLQRTSSTEFPINIADVQ